MDPLLEILTKANPNPERDGCPSAQVIREMAVGRRSGSDPAFAHVTACAPCYQQFGAARRAFVAGRFRRRLAIAASVAVATLASIVYLTRSPAVLYAELDLRPFSVVRSENATPPPPIRIPPSRITAEITLPVGSEAGEYEVQIVTPERLSRRATTSTASIQNGLTKIAVDFDLTGLDRGPYQLALRRGDNDWRYYPLELR